MMLIKAEDVYLASGIKYWFMYFRNEESIIHVAEHRTRTESITSVRSGNCSTIPVVNTAVVINKIIYNNININVIYLVCSQIVLHFT